MNIEILSSCEPYFVSYDAATDLEPGPGYFFAIETVEGEHIYGPFSSRERAEDAKDDLLDALEKGYA